MKRVLLIALAFLIFISLFYGCVDKNVQVEKKKVENAQNEYEIEKQAAIESLKKQIEIQQMEVDELKKEIEHQKEIERKIIEDYEKSLYGIYKANKLIYHNDDYGFSIEIPEEKYNIKFYNVIQDKIEENIEILNFEFFTEDENESSAIKALIEELKPMMEEIKASFRFDE